MRTQREIEDQLESARLKLEQVRKNREIKFDDLVDWLELVVLTLAWVVSGDRGGED